MSCGPLKDWKVLALQTRLLELASNETAMKQLRCNSEQKPERRGNWGSRKAGEEALGRDEGS